MYHIKDFVLLLNAIYYKLAVPLTIRRYVLRNTQCAAMQICVKGPWE